MKHFQVVYFWEFVFVETMKSQVTNFPFRTSSCYEKLPKEKRFNSSRERVRKFEENIFKILDMSKNLKWPKIILKLSRIIILYRIPILTRALRKKNTFYPEMKTSNFSRRVSAESLLKCWHDSGYTLYLCAIILFVWLNVI
jgi:hypothetical protein